MIGWRFHQPSPLRDMLEQMLLEQRRVRESQRGEPMPVNLHESGAEVVVEASLPGVRPDDIELAYGEGLLTLRASVSVEDRAYVHQEFGSVEYHRQLVLPSDCRFDQAQAECENGILTVRIPKQRPRPPERIRIQVSRRDGGATTIDANKGSDYAELPSKKPARKPPGSRAKKA